jgi:hypothetical protein
VGAAGISGVTVSFACFFRFGSDRLGAANLEFLKFAGVGIEEDSAGTPVVLLRLAAAGCEATGLTTTGGGFGIATGCGVLTGGFSPLGGT